MKGLLPQVPSKKRLVLVRLVKLGGLSVARLGDFKSFPLSPRPPPTPLRLREFKDYYVSLNL